MKENANAFSTSSDASSSGRNFLEALEECERTRVDASRRVHEFSERTRPCVDAITVAPLKVISNRCSRKART